MLAGSICRPETDFEVPSAGIKSMHQHTRHVFVYVPICMDMFVCVGYVCTPKNNSCYQKSQHMNIISDLKLTTNGEDVKTTFFDFRPTWTGMIRCSLLSQMCTNTCTNEGLLRQIHRSILGSVQNSWNLNFSFYHRFHCSHKTSHP